MIGFLSSERTELVEAVREIGCAKYRVRAEAMYFLSSIVHHDKNFCIHVELGHFLPIRRRRQSSRFLLLAERFEDATHGLQWVVVVAVGEPVEHALYVVRQKLAAEEAKAVETLRAQEIDLPLQRNEWPILLARR